MFNLFAEEVCHYFLIIDLVLNFLLSFTKCQKANLWAWNGPRVGYAGSPINPKFAEQEEKKVYGEQQIQFTNTGGNPLYAEVDMYYEDQFWAPFSHGSPTVKVNTYDGHIWNIKRKSDRKVLLTWIIGQGERKLLYKV